MDGVDLETLNGVGTRNQLDEIQQVYAAAFPEYNLTDHRQRTLRQTEAPGFTAVTARARSQLAGFVYGLPLRSSAWWDGLDPPAEVGFTDETGTRTFAIIDLAVLPSHRGQGLGKQLLDTLLHGRDEERATLATSPHEGGAQAMYERWGWSKVGRTPGGEGETEPEFDLYVIALR